MSFRFRGKSLQQAISALQWRINLLTRKLRVSWIRRQCAGQENDWLKTVDAVLFTMTPEEARKILKENDQDQDNILADADDVLSGVFQVPQFGRCPINLDTPDTKNREANYQYRMLARLDFLRPLVRAALAAGDPAEFAAEVEAHISKWWQVRQKSGPWDSVDESIRILNLLEAVVLLRDQIKRDVFLDGLRSILAAAWTVQANRAYTGNHLIYEGLALFYAGCSFKGHPQAEKWRTLGATIMRQTMHTQVFNDGFNAELSTSYHLITGTNFIKAWAIARKAGQQFPGWFSLKLTQMAIVAYKLLDPEGTFFPFGDSDRMGGPGREEREARAFAELGMTIAHPSKNARTSLELRMLLAGMDSGSNMAFDHTGGKSHISAGGYQILRYQHGKTLVFDTGSFGLSGVSHHGHADTLSLVANLRDSRFLVDPGGFSYVDSDARQYARSTAAHNTIRVDGQNSSEIIGDFGFGRGANGVLTDVKEIFGGVVLTAEHDGYSDLPQPVTHRRALIWMIEHPFFLIVVDQLSGKGSHLAEAFFHVDYDWIPDGLSEEGLIWMKEQHLVQHQYWSDQHLVIRIATGEKEPEWQGWVAPAYGEFVAAPVIVQQTEAEFPVNIVNAFYKSENPEVVMTLDGNINSVKINDTQEINWRWDYDRLNVTVR
ncbi:MAG: alginate lyase family protein [bacterium]